MTSAWVLGLVMLGSFLFGYASSWRNLRVILAKMCAQHEDSCPARKCGQEQHCRCYTPPEYITQIRKRQSERDDYWRHHRAP